MARILPSAITVSYSPRIMVYSHDAYGLGNIRRMLAICQSLLKSIPNLSILLVSGSPLLHSFRLPQGLDYIKLPCLNRGSLGEMKAKYLNTDIESTLKLRAELILAAAKNYQPDLVLVDKKPLGILGELKQTVDYLKLNLSSTKLVLLLRDILDTPEKTVQEWQRENYYSILESIYDRILVVGMPEIFDLVQEYKFNEVLSSEVRYCGYIRKESGLKNRRMIRQELKMKPNEKLVLVTPGGGEDGYHLIHNYLMGVAQQQDHLNQQNIRSLIFCGAEMPPEQQQQIHQQALILSGVTILEFTDDLMSYVNTADAVISMCGYNTITEVLQKGRKAIVIPRVKPGREQLIRAQSLEKAGLVQMIHPDQLHPSLLMNTLLKTLEKTENNSIDIFAIPSLNDGCPNALLEAMLAEKAVIGTKVDAIAEIIEDGVNGLLVNPYSSKELAAAINELMNRPLLRQAFGKSAKQTVLQECHPLIEQANWAKVYQRVLASHVQPEADIFAV